jgi:hypothetical protein
MYNVLEKLRAGAPLDEADERVKNDGLVLILKELHDKLDALVFKAYGWSQELSDEEVIARLVSLNKERAAEEAQGQVRWLRPEYQKSRAGIVGAPSVAPERQGEMALTSEPGKVQKPRFPTDELARTAAVMAALAAASGAASAASIAGTFQQGKQIEPHIQATLLSLARMGYVSAQDGRAFQLRRAA